MLHNRVILSVRLRAVMIVVSAGLVVAACGSSSSHTAPSSAAASTPGTTASATPSSSAPASSSAAAGAPIRIGMLCSCSGAFQPVFGNMPALVSVWEKAVNNSGGINGHPVQVILKDVADSPAQAQAAARELATSDHVMAVVGSMTTLSPTYTSYLASQGIPQIGGQPDDVAFETSPLFFPTGGNHASMLFGMVDAAKQDGNTKFSMLYCAEYPSCATLVPAMTPVLAAVGGGAKLVYSGKVAASDPSFIAQCLGIKSSGANAGYLALASSTVLRVMTDCAQQGVKIREYTVTGILTNQILQSPYAAGTKVSYINPPLLDNSTAGGAYISSMLDHYQPGLKSDPTAVNALTPVWAGLQMFRKAGDLGKLTPTSTPTEVLKALYRIHGETLGGLAPPVTYTKGQGTHIDCWWTGAVQSGKIALVSNKPQCIPSARASSVEKAFGGKG
jgi:branched-chain amino acid transport system substrate-binding protein